MQTNLYIHVEAWTIMGFNNVSVDCHSQTSNQFYALFMLVWHRNTDICTLTLSWVWIIQAGTLLFPVELTGVRWHNGLKEIY